MAHGHQADSEAVIVGEMFEVGFGFNPLHGPMRKLEGKRPEDKYLCLY